MDFIKAAIQQPVTVVVGVVLLIMAGMVALARIPIQLTPNVEDTIISVRTTWEGASPQEIEQEIIDKQEEKLQGLSNLRTMTSQSMQGQGSIRLEFNIGADQEAALFDISEKLREVSDYPENADEPVVEATDFESRDYIAWLIFGTTDPNLDVRMMQDFAEDRLRPALERVPGISEVGVLGGRERETQIRFDPVLLAQRGVTPRELVNAIRGTNVDVSAGEVEDAKSNVRVRTISQYGSVEDVERTLIKQTPGGPVTVQDVAEVVENFKEQYSFVRSKGQSVIAINAQREIGSNVMEVMERFKEEIARLNAPGGLLDAQARKMGLNGTLTLTQVFDQTIYIDQALDLVQENIWVGGALAVIALMIFLRSFRSVTIIVISTPISVVGAIVAMVVLGRTINVISLAGMAFAIGMVVDNAIVILENIFRHLEMGKKPMHAAYDGTKEVWGAVLAATLTNIIVFIPILLIQEEAGQLFRDIALAICATAALSLVVCITVVPTMAARMMKTVPKSMQHHHYGTDRVAPREVNRSRLGRILAWPMRPVKAFIRWLDALPDALAYMIYWMSGSWGWRIGVVAGLTLVSLVGSYLLMPPADYLPKGNQNLVFGLMIPPPGYNLDQQEAIAQRVEATIQPYWEASDFEVGSPEYEEAWAKLPAVVPFDFMTGQVGDPVIPAPINNYFFVAFDGIMFQGGVSTEDNRVVDMLPLFAHATRSEVMPGVLAFAQQFTLFDLGGASGSAVKINFSGDDLGTVTNVADAMYMAMAQKFGFGNVQPDPGNFNLPNPELRVVPDLRRLGEVGMTPADLGLAVQANGDGAIIGEYRVGGESIDLKIIAKDAVDRRFLTNLGDVPIATPVGMVVPLSSLATLERVMSPPQINRVARQRAVTMQFTAPEGMPLEAAINDIDAMIADSRAKGIIPPEIRTDYSGSASKLKGVQAALLGDGTLIGTLGSSLALALLITYLLMCVLYQSFLYPLVIMFSVPLATLGGFAALYGVYQWSKEDRYMPDQMMDVLTMLGFIILIGVVVNNAILLVHQTLNLLKGVSDVEGLPHGVPLEPRQAITESVRTRVRPILMSLFTSVVGMLPLVVSPGAGSELYRGLGAVVLGGLVVSTIFTLILIPLLMSIVMDAKAALTQAWVANRAVPASGAALAEPTRSPES